MTTPRARSKPAAAAIFAVLLLIGLSIGYLDRPLALWASGFDPSFVALCAQITRLGNSAWYLIPLGTALPLLYLASRRERNPTRALRLRRLLWVVLFLFLAIAVSGLLADLLKILFGRARPSLLLRNGDFGWYPLSFTAKLQSFPSGHANTVTALALALGLVLRRLRLSLAAFAAIVAFTRIAVGGHYLSDIVAGAALAVATTLWLRAAFARRGWLSADAPQAPPAAPRRPAKRS